MNNETDIHEVNRERLRAIQQRFQLAVRNNTIEDMREHVDSDFSFVSFTDKSFESFDAFAKQWEISRSEMVGTGSFSTEMNPESTLFENNIAICKGNAVNQLVDNNGESFDFNSHWTVILRYKADEWKVVRAHNSLDPFANPMLVSGVKKRFIKTGIIAFLVGVVATFIVVNII